MVRRSFSSPAQANRTEENDLGLCLQTEDRDLDRTDELSCLLRTTPLAIAHTHLAEVVSVFRGTKHAWRMLKKHGRGSREH